MGQAGRGGDGRGPRQQAAGGLAHTDEVEVQEDLVASHENFAAAVLHRLQQRAEHLSSFSNQLLKENITAVGDRALVTRPVTHSTHMFAGPAIVQALC